MDTVIVTLELPIDVFNFVKKYAKPRIINEQFSNTGSIKNTSVFNTTRLENPLNNPTLDDVVAYAKEINSSVNPQRFFTYYERREWVDKNGLNFDWKQKLREWGTYNLEKSTTSTSKNAPAKCDFTNDTSFQSSVADLLADNKKGVA